MHLNLHMGLLILTGEFMDNELDKIHLMIVNDDQSEVENIRLWLTQDMRVPWSSTHCVKVAEVLSRANKVDLIILKPEMAGLASPEQVFKSVEGVAFEVPIIVLTNLDDPHGLSTYVMEQGAADTVIRGQFARLVDAIEFALIRQKLTTEARVASDKTILDSEEKGSFDRERHKQILRMFCGDYSIDQSK